MVKKRNGAKSKEFGCFWKAFFMSTLCYPDKINMNNKEHIKIMKKFKQHYNSISYILPCRFCAEFTRNVLMKKYPLDFTGRMKLMHGLYLWKDTVNNKLIAQGCTFTKKSPPFSQVVKKYEDLRATCNKKLGKCV